MEFLWTAPDGLVFPGERWEPAGPARGVLIYLHGMSGAATDFHALATPVADAGLAGFAMNLRGQGHDPVTRRRGTELDLIQLEQDIVAFAEAAIAEYPGLPVFWCGESMGSLVLMHLLTSPSFDIPVAGAIFSSPVVALRQQTPPVIRKALGLLARMAPRFRLYPGWFVNGHSEPLRVTRDEDHRAKIRASSHFIEAFSLGFLDSLGTLIESSPRLAARVQAPSLVLAAGQDVFIEAQQIKEWFDLLGAKDKTLYTYPDAFHCLWNDFDRELVIADIIGWFETRA
jgi:acylglycerol lipase